jgi:hypothetical protein
MRRHQFLTLLSLLFLSVQQRAGAQDVQVPAGTLLRCTLNEPDFSSKSAKVGDPVLCNVSAVQEFGRAVFPRGAYTAGHLEADKEPGHFWGKGYLKLVFDRIGLPNTDVPIDARVIAARGFHVDREGDILGKGHSKRDATEWMFPPLWPWKILTLPARGPRPTLKGEEVLTLRLMADVTVPRMVARSWPDWRPPRPQASASTSSGLYASSSYNGRPNLRRWRYAPPSYPAMTNTSENGTYVLPSPPQVPPASPAEVFQAKASQLTLLALKNEMIYAVTQYWVDGDRLSYLRPSGASGDLSLDELDWARTTQLNSERGVSVTLRTRPPHTH